MVVDGRLQNKEEIVRLIIIGELINELQFRYTCCSIVHYKTADGPWKIIKNVWLSTELRRRSENGMKNDEEPKN